MKDGCSECGKEILKYYKGHGVWVRSCTNCDFYLEKEYR